MERCVPRGERRKRHEHEFTLTRYTDLRAEAVDGGGTNRYTNAVAIRPNISPTIAEKKADRENNAEENLHKRAVVEACGEAQSTFVLLSA